MRIPTVAVNAIVVHSDEANPRFDQPAGHQGRLPEEVPAIAVARRSPLLPNVEGPACFSRSNECQGPFFKVVVSVDRGVAIERVSQRIELLDQARRRLSRSSASSRPPASPWIENAARRRCNLANTDCRWDFACRWPSSAVRKRSQASRRIRPVAADKAFLQSPQVIRHNNIRGHFGDAARPCGGLGARLVCMYCAIDPIDGQSFGVALKPAPIGMDHGWPV